MLKAAQTSEKCLKSPFQPTLGMLSIPKHPQVVRPWLAALLVAFSNKGGVCIPNFRQDSVVFVWSRVADK